MQVPMLNDLVGVNLTENKTAQILYKAVLKSNEIKELRKLMEIELTAKQIRLTFGIDNNNNSDDVQVLYESYVTELNLILEEIDSIDEWIVINDINKLRDVREIFSDKIKEILNDKGMDYEQREQQYEFLQERNEAFLAAMALTPTKYKNFWKKLGE